MRNPAADDDTTADAADQAEQAADAGLEQNDDEQGPEEHAQRATPPKNNIGNVR